LAEKKGSKKAVRCPRIELHKVPLSFDYGNGSTFNAYLCVDMSVCLLFRWKRYWELVVGLRRLSFIGQQKDIKLKSLALSKEKNRKIENTNNGDKGRERGEHHLVPVETEGRRRLMKKQKHTRTHFHGE
jgi:hypothetical protein